MQPQIQCPFPSPFPYNGQCPFPFPYNAPFLHFTTPHSSINTANLQCHKYVQISLTFGKLEDFLTKNEIS